MVRPAEGLNGACLLVGHSAGALPPPGDISRGRAGQNNSLPGVPTSTNRVASRLVDLTHCQPVGAPERCGHNKQHAAFCIAHPPDHHPSSCSPLVGQCAGVQCGDALVLPKQVANLAAAWNDDGTMMERRFARIRGKGGDLLPRLRCMRAAMLAHREGKHRGWHGVHTQLTASVCRAFCTRLTTSVRFAPNSPTPMSPAGTSVCCNPGKPVGRDGTVCWGCSKAQCMI